MKKIISIVVPIYNEAGNILSLYSSIKRVVNALPEYQWNYVFVNDGSSDGSYEILRRLSQDDSAITVLDFSRNFGKEVALSAGVHQVGDCDAVICIDADLQHPPELIPSLIEKWESGAEVVVTIREEIERQPIIRRIGSFLYYRLMNSISGINMKARTTDFRLYDKKVIKAFLRATERERMFRGIMDWMGFHRAYIQFKAPARTNGNSVYSYRKLWKLAINSLTSFSLWPLRVAGYMGIFISSSSGMLFLWMIANYLIEGKFLYTPLAMAVVINMFLIGIVLMSIGLVALYIGVIHTEVVNRPLYIIRERLSRDR